jgi:hypothetical protein
MNVPSSSCCRGGSDASLCAASAAFHHDGERVQFAVTRGNEAVRERSTNLLALTDRPTLV